MDYVEQVLAKVRENGLFPTIRTTYSAATPEVVIDGRTVLSFCSNNYLGMATHPKVTEAAIEAIKKYGTSCGGSRLISGNLSIEEELENEVADFKGYPAAITFMTGLMANTGAIPALMNVIDAYGLPKMKQEDNIILSDELNHASIIDGCRLSRAEKIIYKHRDTGDLEKILKNHKNKRKLIVTDGVFSMDGDIAPVGRIVELAKQYNALVFVDDAHATGILGLTGRGTAEHFNVEGKVDLVMGTFSKAFGGVGGFIVSSKEIVDFLRVRARDYIFSSALPPATAAGLTAAVREVRSNSSYRANLWKNIAHMKDGLKQLGFDTLGSETQIMPVAIGDEAKAMKMADLLFEEGIFIPCVRWPAVPQGKSRLRCTVMATHTPEQIDRALAAFKKVGKNLGVI